MYGNKLYRATVAHPFEYKSPYGYEMVVEGRAVRSMIKRRDATWNVLYT